MRLPYLVFILLVTYACQAPQEVNQEHIPIPASLEIASIDTIAFATSIRALEVVDDSTIWWAGSGGKYGYSIDAGQTWVVDSIQWDTLQPHFRSIAVTNEAVFLLSIASPALLFRSVDQGKEWELVYQENHPGAFYDAMAFWNDREGLAMGDPTDGCLSVIRTLDGGQTWEKLSCDQLPPAEEGEAAFAASNSNIALFGEQAWIVSGGKRARVFHSPDRGESWSVVDSPIAEGEQMTGIFSVDFYDAEMGIIFGGDWNDKAINSQNKALSTDGGKTWKALLDGAGPGYQSCVKFLPYSDAKAILTCGIPGIHYSSDQGQSWSKLSEDSWYTLGFGSSWQTTWLAGNGKVGKIRWKTQTNE
ncbi:MAG: oxidoreductase [Saprospiraceae bacterium]|nr:oxidoreductase [Saprospiraceae bacterium]